MEPRDPPPDRIRGTGAIALAIVAASIILSFSSWTAAPPRYQIAAANGVIVRLDTDSGALLACELERCRQVQPPARAAVLNPLNNIVRNIEGRTAEQPKRLP